MKFLNIDIEEHHRGRFKYHLHNSMLKELAKSPAHLKAYWEKPREPTKQMRIGTLYHCLALQQELPPSAKPDEFEVAKNMYDVLQGHRLASAIVRPSTQSVIEHSVEYKDPDYQFDCIIRPDVYLKQHRIIVDLKSTSDASTWAFKKSMRFFKYHWQAWFYLRGIPEAERFWIIAQETSPPFGIMVYEIGRHWIDTAHEEVMPLLGIYARCLASNDWPQYPQDVITI